MFFPPLFIVLPYLTFLLVSAKLTHKYTVGIEPHLPALAMNFMDVVRHRGRCARVLKYNPSKKIQVFYSSTYHGCVNTSQYKHTEKYLAHSTQQTNHT